MVGWHDDVAPVDRSEVIILPGRRFRDFTVSRWPSDPAMWRVFYGNQTPHPEILVPPPLPGTFLALQRADPHGDGDYLSLITFTAPPCHPRVVLSEAGQDRMAELWAAREPIIRARRLWRCLRPFGQDNLGRPA